MGRAEIETAKAAAREKAQQAKRDAKRRVAKLKNPPPQYVNMPEPTGDAEVDSANDLGELERGFRRRAADERRRFALVTDSEFWGAICFQTRAQRDAFFVAIGAQPFGVGGRYFDGNAIAKMMGIELPQESVPFRADKQPDPTWVEFVKVD